MTQQRKQQARNSVGRRAGLTTLSLALTVMGCRPAAPGGGAPNPPQAELPEVPKGEAIADPVLREAREQADAILNDLLAGKHDEDQDLWPVARKLKGYQSCSIKLQKIIRERTADFQGVLRSQEGRARFAMALVKQLSGKWAIGTFSGPNPQVVGGRSDR